MAEKRNDDEETRSTCVLLLSDKSSGSSALQAVLAAHEDVHLVPFTRHQENETLYWVKAVAILGLPQPRLINSVVPLAPEVALEELHEFLERNLGGPVTPDPAGDWIFEGWLHLCRRLRPVFLEKSPHHLHTRSALDLILKCADRWQAVEFRFIGLVRNPMDTLYSKWRRWGHIPEESQYEWLRAYRNLQRFVESAGDRLLIVRYEELVSDGYDMKPIWDHCRLSPQPPGDRNMGLHAKAIGRWKQDSSFGFLLSEEVHACAVEFGYEPTYLRGHRSFLWPLRRAQQTILRRARGRLGALHRSVSRRSS